MILVRSPLRITLGGGGTDLPSYASRFGGFCLTAAIDQYVYVAVTKPWEPGIRLKYSQCEQVSRVEDVQHPIIREALKMTGVGPPVEIVSLADVPAGTGLGSSGAFTVALWMALKRYQHARCSAADAAKAAFVIEAGRLGAPVGWQDAYASALGGPLQFRSEPGAREPEVCGLERDSFSVLALRALQHNLLLFYAGGPRAADERLADQRTRTEADDPAMLANLDAVKALAYRTASALSLADMPEFAACLDEQWALKRGRSPGMSSPEIDAWYALGKANGALGGKLVGAGGGGFLLFYTEEHRRLRAAMTGAGLRELRFRFDWEGTKVLTT